MNYLKTLFLSLITLLVLFPQTSQAQWNEGVAAIVKTQASPQVNKLIASHLKAISNKDSQSFKATYGGRGVFNDTIMSHFKAATSRGYVVTQDLQELRANPPQAFAPGGQMKKDFLIIIVPLKATVSSSHRLPYDLLGISAELGASLKKHGVNPQRSMAFLVHKQKLKVVYDKIIWEELAQ